MPMWKGRRTPGVGGGRLRRTKVTAVSVGLALGLIATACSSSSKPTSSGSAGSTGSNGSAGSTGSNGSEITIGIVTPLTGAAAVNYKGSAESAQARVDVQNANGGVNGHKLKLIV